MAPARWRDALHADRLPRAVEAVAFVGVPVAEITVAALLVAGPVRAGWALAVLLLLGFSAAILRARSFQGRLVRCGCLGGSERRDYRLLLGRNAFLAALAGWPLLANARGAPIAPGVPAGGDVVAAITAGIGLLAGAWVTSVAVRILRSETTARARLTPSRWTEEASTPAASSRSRAGRAPRSPRS